jgi:formate hydrogenlyase transcriptional activator
MNSQSISREEESLTSFCLSIGTAVSAIKSKEDLTRFLDIKLSEMLGFEYSTIFIFNSDNTALSDFLAKGISTTDCALFKPIIKAPATGFSINRQDGYSNDIWLNNNEIKRRAQPNVFHLVNGGELLGYWVVYFAERVIPTYELKEKLEAISSQIGLLTAKIHAEELLMNRERETKSHLAEINNYKQLLEQEKTYLKEEIEISHNYAEIIGESSPMQKVFRLMAQVSHADSTVLLLGETGTGKEVVARAIHNNSPRKNKLMVKVNCAALPANLIESELFGHERGSFTGATERRLGKFELANGGTLFLDEIGEMPLELQVKLLRVLQEREIERIGGRGIIKVDVRIIAATNRDLEKEMELGRFRSDLYYRLNIFPITLPPLRDRKEDIPMLASHFISHFGKKAGRKIKTISTRALQDMIVYNWPGNIRELEHLMERSILLSEGDMLKQIHLPAQKNIAVKQPEKAQFQIRTIDDNERQHILDTLKYCQGRVGGYSGAAELLGVPPSTLFSKMKKLGIKRDVISDNLSQ